MTLKLMLKGNLNEVYREGSEKKIENQIIMIVFFYTKKFSFLREGKLLR